MKVQRPLTFKVATISGRLSSLLGPDRRGKCTSGICPKPVGQESRSGLYTPAKSETQSRKARAGSVRVAPQAGQKHAASEATAITTSAEPNAAGSRGLTRYNKF